MDPMLLPSASRAYLRAMLEELVVGKRVEFTGSLAPDPSPAHKPGRRGTAIDVDDLLSVTVRWDDGGTLSLLYGVDEYRLLDEGEGGA